MAQVASNLLANALTHGARDEAVRVWVGGTANELRLSVHDGGSPIPPELMPEIFEPFRRGRRTAGASHARGLGLGLYIAKQIVTAHGGEIEVRSTAEDGTTFTVRVPREVGIETLRGDGATVQQSAPT